MSKLTVLDHSGDSGLVWDLDLDTPENAAVIADTESIVNAALERRSTVMRVEADGETTTKLKEFDASAPEIVIIPQLVGG